MSKITTLFILCVAISFTLAEKEVNSKSVKDNSKTEKKQDKRGLFDLGYGYGGNYGYGSSNYGGFDSSISSVNHYGLNDYNGLEHGHHINTVTTITKEVPVLHPYPVAVEKHVPYPVKVPVAVPVDRPYPVHVPKPYPVHIEKHVPYPVEKPVPYPVKVPVKIPVAHPVPYAVHKPYPVHIEKHVPYPVSHPVLIEKEVPIFIKDHGHHHFEHGDLDGYGLGAYGSHESLSYQ